VGSIVIPGSGEPHLDSQEYFTNPHADKRQEREQQVRSLLDKLQPDMIALDPDVVGTIETGNDRNALKRQRREAHKVGAKMTAATGRNNHNHNNNHNDDDDDDDDDDEEDEDDDDDDNEVQDRLVPSKETLRIERYFPEFAVVKTDF